jgi:hypothetical protein
VWCPLEGMVLDDCAVPEGPSALVQYIAVLVALYLIEGVAAASQLILTTIVSERLGLRLRRAAFHSALNQEVLYVEQRRADDLAAVIHRHVQRVQVSPASASRLYPLLLVPSVALPSCSAPRALPLRFLGSFWVRHHCAHQRRLQKKGAHSIAFRSGSDKSARRQARSAADAADGAIHVATPTATPGCFRGCWWWGLLHTLHMCRWRAPALPSASVPGGLLGVQGSREPRQRRAHASYLLAAVAMAPPVKTLAEIAGGGAARRVRCLPARRCRRASYISNTPPSRRPPPPYMSAPRTLKRPWPHTLWRQG